MSDTLAAAPVAPEVATTQEGEQPQAEVKETPVAFKAKPPSFRKIKVGNEEISLSDADIARDYSKWKGADAKFREANEAKAGVEKFMKALQEDPESVLSDPRLPIDRRKLAEKWLTKQIQEELTPPDPRDAKLSAAEQKLREYEEKEANEKKAKEETELGKVREERKTAISKTLREAMEVTHLSKDPESAASVLREMAMYMRAAKERGEEVTPDQLVEHIHNQRFGQFYALAHQYEGEELIEFFGEEIVKRIRAADLKRLRATRESGESHRSESPAHEPEKSRARVDGYEMRRRANKTLLGK